MNNIIDFLEKRECVDAITSEELKKSADQKKLKVYIGFDPTADSLHIGNLVGLILLVWFQRFGHTPVAVIGGATAKIGDPSGKSIERPLLDLETLNHNKQAIEKQIRACFSSSEGEELLFLDNDQWLGEYGFIDFLRDVGKHFRMGPMLGKESVRARLNSDTGMSFTEFSYQMLQGYDFHYLLQKHDVNVQMGGSDQWGNITAGTEFIRKLTDRSAFGLTYPLLTKSDGSKFGKSEQGAIWLDPKKTSPYQFYQFFLNTSDQDVIKVMRMLTFIELEEILAFEEAFKAGNFIPYAAQKRLAEEITLFIHGKEGLQTALRVTEAAAPGSAASLDPLILEEIAKDMPHATLSLEQVLDQNYPTIACNVGFLSSKGEGTRLIKSGGAYLNNEKVTESTRTITKDDVIGGKYLLLGAGKKKKILIKIG